MGKLKLTPIDNHLIVKQVLPPEVSSGGIFFPERANRSDVPYEGIVLAVGPGDWVCEKNERHAIAVQIGDRVLVSRYGGTAIVVDGEKLRIITADDIFAIVTEEEV